MDSHTLLIAAHIVGTVIGVGGATFAEIFYLKAIKDGVVDPIEKGFLQTTYTVLRVGLALIIVSGIALVLYDYFVLGETQILTSAKLWAKNTLVAVIIVNAVLIARRVVPIWLGVGVSFTSWYGALILGAWQNIPYSYFEIMIGYVVAVFAVSGILEIIKQLYVGRPL